MTYCNEFAVFEVAAKNQEEIIELSLSLFKEMNVEEKVLISHQIMRKTDNPEQICWHLVWRDEAAVAVSKTKWSTYPSAKAIESLVSGKLYYGHFLDVFLD
jgi:quinol monooxygenase YgiN